MESLPTEVLDLVLHWAWALESPHAHELACVCRYWLAVLARRSGAMLLPALLDNRCLLQARCMLQRMKEAPLSALLAAMLHAPRLVDAVAEKVVVVQPKLNAPDSNWRPQLRNDLYMVLETAVRMGYVAVFQRFLPAVQTADCVRALLTMTIDVNDEAMLRQCLQHELIAPSNEQLVHALNTNVALFDMLYEHPAAQLDAHLLHAAVRKNDAKFLKRLLNDSRVNMHANTFPTTLLQTAITSIRWSSDKPTMVNVLLADERIDPNEQNHAALKAAISHEYKSLILVKAILACPRTRLSGKDYDTLIDACLKNRNKGPDNAQVVQLLRDAALAAAARIVKVKPPGNERGDKHNRSNKRRQSISDS